MVRDNERRPASDALTHTIAHGAPNDHRPTPDPEAALYIGISAAARELGIHRITAVTWAAKGRLELVSVTDVTGVERDVLTRESVERVRLELETERAESAESVV